MTLLYVFLRRRNYSAHRQPRLRGTERGAVCGHPGLGYFRPQAHFHSCASRGSTPGKLFGIRAIEGSMQNPTSIVRLRPMLMLFPQDVDIVLVDCATTRANAFPIQG